MVATRDLKSLDESRAGSSPASSTISSVVMEKLGVHPGNALSMPALVANTWYAVDVSGYGSCLYLRNKSKANFGRRSCIS